MNFKEEQVKRLEYIEAIICDYLPKEEGFQKQVFEAMNYSVLAGGKRLRPMLMLETFRLFGGSGENCIKPFMAAVEMIHTYSLVHDDLPAMDNDEFRRGRKTTHVVYGEAMGILAGDGLLNYAFEIISTALMDLSEDNLMRAIKALGILSKKAGIYGMIGGQVMDVEETDIIIKTDLNAETEVNAEVLTNFQIDHKNIQNKLNFMYKLKTSALIEAAMMIGAVLAGAGEQEILLVERMASDIGLAFQIQDDILDATSTTEKIGKPAHSDERNNKLTYITLLGLEKAREEVVSLSARGLYAFDTLHRNNVFLKELIRKLITRDK
ncbi:MAG: polyprenyl synthetase family protein [Anaerocolumna sp.]